MAKSTTSTTSTRRPQSQSRVVTHDKYVQGALTTVATIQAAHGAGRMQQVATQVRGLATSLSISGAYCTACAQAASLLAATLDARPAPDAAGLMGALPQLRQVLVAAPHAPSHGD